MPFAQFAGGGSQGRSRTQWGTTQSAASQKPRYDVDSVNRQIENAVTRIRDAGYDISDADRRNWFERATNLPEGQNAFFDALELLGRGGNAVKNVIDKTLIKDEQDALTALGRGVSGRDKVDATDFVERMGIDNNVAKALLGFGIDVATDPLTFVPGAAFAKAGGAIGQGARAGVKALERRSPGFAQFNDTVTRPTRDALGRMFVPDYKLDEDLFGRADDTISRAKQQTENRIAFMNEEAMKNVSDAARAAGGIDTGRDVGRLMERDLRQFEDVRMYEFPDGVRRTENRRDILDEARNVRGQIKETGKELREAQKQYREAIGDFAKGIDDTNREINRLFAGIERKVGRELDADKRKDLRSAQREIKRVESQIANLPQAEKAMLQAFKKQVREAHEMNFDVLKQIREAAPNGVRMVDYEDVPVRMRHLVRNNGKPIDEVAQELGYQRADDLVEEVRRLDSVPRKLTNEEIERLARAEMERTGSFTELADMRAQLESSRSSLQDIHRALTGEMPDVEARAFAELAQNPRWQQFEQQRQELLRQHRELLNESRGVREERLQRIRELESEMSALRESARNPVMVQREIPRPEREMPTDPAINAAARNLMRSNAELRQWALDNGVTVGELEGYMKHILSKAERAERAKVRAMPVDRGNRGAGQPNKRVVQPREIAGSVEDVNERIGREFFEPNAYFATAVGQKQLIEYVNAAAFRREVLSNPNFAQKYKKGMTVPKNAVVIDTSNYKFLPDDMGELAQDIGGEYVVTKSVKQALDRYKRLTDDEGINSFLKAYDKLQSGWKRLALFSPMYHLRNDVGAKFNNWIGGMSIPNVVKYSQQAQKEVFEGIVQGKETALFREFREQGLGSSGLSAVEYARRGVEPEDAMRRTIEKRSRFDGTLGGRVKAEVMDWKNPLNVFETSRQIGDYVDRVNRYALYKWARDKGMSPEQAAKKVRDVQFDYERTTPFEREVATRVVPFYRWMRNNLPFQIRSFVNDPRKFVAIDKLRQSAQDAVGIDDENVPDWMKESFAFPVYGEDGSGKFLGLNLPIGDVARAAEPGKMVMDSVSPLLKLPAELTLNRNFFYDRPISRFQGQEKQYQLPFPGGPEFGIESRLAYLLEQLGGQVGRGVSGYLQRPEEEDQDAKFRTPSLGIRSLLKDFDAEASEYFERRDELQNLLDLINYIQQQEGVRPRSVNEIRAGAR